MTEKIGLTINETSQGKMIGMLSWGSFLATFLLPIIIIAPLIIHLIYKDKFYRHKDIFTNLRSAYKLSIANLVLIGISFILYITIILAPVAILMAIVMAIVNIVYAIRGMIRVSNIKLEGQNFDYIETDS